MKNLQRVYYPFGRWFELVSKPIVKKEGQEDMDISPKEVINWISCPKY